MRWFDPQPPLTLADFKLLAREIERASRASIAYPMPAWLCRTMEKRRFRAEWFRALGLSK